MDYAYTFGDPRSLYLNVTNRCTNSCVFCVGRHADGLGSGRLRGGPEPTLEDLLAAVDVRGGAAAFDELVFCGFGEPTFRLDLIVGAGPVFRSAGARVRLNTNGHGCLIHGRDLLPELAEAVDCASVSLNAPTAERYAELCRPGLGWGREEPGPGRYWEATLGFLSRAPRRFAEVQATVVGHVLARDELDRCETLARELGCPGLRVR